MGKIAQRRIKKIIFGEIKIRIIKIKKERKNKNQK